jgi:uncharacterized membrane protein
VTPLSLFLILVSLATFVAGQLLLKHAMASTIARGFRQRTFMTFLLTGTATMAVSFFLLLGLLQKYDLSKLDPFQGLSVIFTSMAAVFFLREKMTLRLTIGSLLITGGLILVSFS